MFTSMTGLLVMIPQCVKNLHGPIRSLKQEDHEPNSGGFNKVILAPSKLLWLALVDCIIVIIFIILSAGSGSILMSVTFAMIVIYFLYLGIPFGSLTSTLSRACEDLTTEVGSYERAIGLLARYEDLKKSSQLGMFTVSSSCALITITNTYYTFVILVYKCYGPTSMFMYLLYSVLTSFQAKAFATFFCFIACSADECYRSMTGLSKHLR